MLVRSLFLGAGRHVQTRHSGLHEDQEDPCQRQGEPVVLTCVWPGPILHFMGHCVDGLRVNLAALTWLPGIGSPPRMQNSKI